MKNVKGGEYFRKALYILYTFTMYFNNFILSVVKMAPKTTKERSQAYREKIKADPIKYEEKLKRTHTHTK